MSDSGTSGGRSGKSGTSSSGSRSARAKSNSRDDAHTTSDDQPNEEPSQEQPWWYANADGFEPPNPVDVGTAAQEAVKLAASVAQWAEQSGLSDTLRGIVDQAAEGLRTASRASAGSPGATADGGNEQGAGGSSGEHPDDDGHGRSTCDSCPICQGVDLIKTMSPEAANGITDALAAVSAAVRQAVDGLTPSGSESSTKVEHIDID